MPGATALAVDPTPIVSSPNLQATETSTPTPAIPDHELARSVIQIQAIDTTGGFVRTVRDGTGVIVDREAGLLLTAYPLVRPYLTSGVRAYSTIGVAVNDGNGGSPRLAYEAELIAVDELLGLAVLRVTREYQGNKLTSGAFGFPAAEIGDSNVIAPSDPLRLFGHPGLDNTAVDSQALQVTGGTVTGRRGEPDRPGTTKLKLDAQLPYGHTGGPAFDLSGALVGLLMPEFYETEVTVTQLRPFALAIELIERASKLPLDVEFIAPLHAQEPPAGFGVPIPGDGAWVSRPLFAENATASGKIFDLYDYERGFISGTQALFFEFAVQGTEPGAAVEERWFLNGVLQDSLSSSYSWDNGNFALIGDQISVPAGALPNGRWTLEVWINDALRSTSTAIVGVELDPPTMTNSTFGSAAGAAGLSTAAPSSLANQLLLFFDYSGMEITQGVRWVVLRNDQLMYQSPELRWPGGGAGRFWVGFGDDEPVGPGVWNFQVLVDGELTLDAIWELF